MSKNRFYLVAKNKNTNEFKKINLHDLGFEKNSLKLEDIDKLTLQFNNPEELNAYLKAKGIVNSSNNDIFIVKRNDSNEEKISYLETIYKGNMTDTILEINKFQRKDSINKSTDSLNKLYFTFINRMYKNEKFYDYITFGNTNVYEKFYIHFIDNSIPANIYKSKINDVTWAYNSYYLARNVYEAINSFDNVKLRNKYNSRDDIKDKLYEVTDKNYFDGQISLFDYYGDKVYAKTKKNS